MRNFTFRFATNGDFVEDGSGLFVDDIRIYDGSGSIVFEDDFESYDVGSSLDPDIESSSVYRGNTFEATVGIEDCGTTNPRPEDVEEINVQPTLNFALAPTVTDAVLRVFSEDLNADAASIYIFNQQGVMMEQMRDINTLGGSINTNLDVSSLPQGMYFIRVIGDNGLSSVKRFIKVN